jgi:CRP-like cAMP-binding protein
MSLSSVFNSILRQHRLFSLFGDENLAQLSQHAKLINLQKNEILCLQEKPIEQFYFVISGCLKLFRSMNDGTEKIIDLATDQDTFAEELIFLEQKHSPFTAQAATASQVIAFSSKYYLEILLQQPELAIPSLQNFSQRLTQRIDDIETLSLKSAAQKVIRYIESNMDKQTEPPCLTLHIAKRLVAQQLSMQPETFSRIIHRLQQAEIIHIQGKKINITDQGALAAFKG